MQPVTPRTTRGQGLCQASSGSTGRRGRARPPSSPRRWRWPALPAMATRVGLRVARLHPRLGPVLDLLRALGGHGDEAELAVHVLGQSDVRHASLLFVLRKVLEDRLGLASMRLVRQRAARITDFTPRRCGRGRRSRARSRIACRGSISSRAARRRRAMVACVVVPRPRSRSPGPRDEGGRMKTLTASRELQPHLRRALHVQVEQQVDALALGPLVLGRGWCRSGLP